MKRLTVTFLVAALACAPVACSKEPLPQPTAGPTPTGAVVSDDRLAAIMKTMEEEIATADAAKDAEQLKGRMTADALAARTAGYALSVKTDGAHGAPVLGFTPQIITPAATPNFPRQALVVSHAAEGQTSPMLLSLVQADARSVYQVDHWVRLFPGVSVPAMPPATQGTAIAAPDADTFAVTPSDALAAYATAIATPDDAANVGDDPLRQGLKATSDALTQALEGVGTATWSAAVSETPPVTYTAADGSGIVVGTISAALTLDKTESGAKLKLSDDLAALGGEDPIEKKAVATYQLMVALHIPAAGGEATIIPLGGEQTLMSVARTE